MALHKAISALLVTTLPVMALATIAFADDGGPVLDKGDGGVEVAGVQSPLTPEDYANRRASFGGLHLLVGQVSTSALLRGGDPSSNGAEVAGVQVPDGGGDAYVARLLASPLGGHISVGMVSTASLMRDDSMR